MAVDRRSGVAAVAAVLFASLTAVVAARHGAPLAWDRAPHRWAVSGRSPMWAGLARGVSFTGTGVPPYLLAALTGVLACPGRPRRWRGAVGGVIALALAEAVRIGLATALARPRPPRSDWATVAGGASFPSGHAATSALVAIGLASALLRYCRRRATRVLVCAVPALWAAGVGVGRVYLGVHWPTDVLAGWLLATVLGCVLLRFLTGRSSEGC